VAGLGDSATAGLEGAVAGLEDLVAVATSVALAVGNLVGVARDGIGSEKTWNVRRDAERE